MGLLKAISEPTTAEKAILLLTTYGGEANAAYRMARWFQRNYQEFVVFPPSICASAGTLLAVGANKIVMCPFSELGPLDVQLAKRNELGERKSGLVTKAAMESLQESAFRFWEYFMTNIKIKSMGQVSFEKSAEIASDVCSNAFSEMYRQINPDVLGQDERDLQVAAHYGRRLAQRGGNISAENVKRLVHDYPSHDFVIDIDEAETIFTSIDEPSEALSDLVFEIGEDALQVINDRKRMIVKRLVSMPALSLVNSNAERQNESTGIEDDQARAA